MPSNSYTSEQALSILLRKLQERNDGLAAQIQEAIDAGTEISETERSFDRRRKPHVYRKKISFTPEQALSVALDALRAHFVEQPLFVNSTAENFAKSDVGVPEEKFPDWAYSPYLIQNQAEPVTRSGHGESKRIEIELQTETQFEKVGVATMPLEPVSRERIAEQRLNLAKLRSLLIPIDV